MARKSKKRFATRQGTTTFYLMLIGGCLLVWGVVLISMFAMGNVKGDEIGVLVNNYSGTMEVYPYSGTYIYNAITSDFLTLDKTEQTIVMTADPNRGDKRTVDFVRVKTRDGSDVSVDVTINYKLLIEPDVIKRVIGETGTGDAYKSKWVRDYSRSVCRNELGKLTTEEFYKSGLRTDKAISDQVLLNKMLNKHGIAITSVQVQSFAFYKEYEEKIKEKKLADQEVEQQKSQADAARERKKKRVMERVKSKEVAIENYKGDLQTVLLKAQEESSKAKRGADVYYYATTQKAEAEFYGRQKEAQAILARRKAESKSLSNLCKALEGDGGKNMVLLEYVKKLSSINLMGQPYSIGNTVEKVQHMGFVPARTSRGGSN